jgi:hypothetical protein
MSTSSLRFRANLAKKGELCSLAAGQLGNHDPFAQFESGGDDLFSEPGQVVVVSAAGFADKTVQAQTLGAVSSFWMPDSSAIRCACVQSEILGSSRMGLEDRRALFAKAGYDEVEIFEERRREWICAMGRKPAA